MNYNTTIGITGVHGFVGGNLRRYFLEKGARVVGFGRQETSKHTQDMSYQYFRWELPGTLDNNKPNIDTLVHCASKVSPYGNMQEFYATNVQGTRSAVESYPAAKHVYISTGSVYTGKKINIAEESTIDTTQYTTAYEVTKRQAELVIIQKAAHYCILRPHIIYGPGDTTIIPRLLRAHKSWLRRMIVFGDAQSTVSPVAVDNLALAVDLGRQDPRNEIYNVVDATNATIFELLEELRNAGRIHYPYLHVPVLVGTIGAYVLPLLSKTPLLNKYMLMQLTSPSTLSIHKITSSLGYLPTINYKTHLAQYYRL